MAEGPRTRFSPPEALLLKGLHGERAAGCWEEELELELNGLGKSETRRGQGREGDKS